ncbi:MAG: RNA methyltransferase [Candidatus Cloacimonadales bacterium]|jgi:TrmH family RNA methyltransferase|nr:RNA methyltransferase [Candidatus Cloacimonadota bacterium]MDD3501151.1 RNA methyltransferase [Candidatus Cloacimonadota bacterium]MDX9978228.1 RNA methyltransferase [Candidatus Cloacimonadales bacterium]
MQKISIKDYKNLKSLTQKKYRKLYRKLIVEGENTIFQLLDNDKSFDAIYITDSYAKNHYRYLEKHITKSEIKERIRLIDEAKIKEVTDTENPQDIIACVSFEPTPINENGTLLYLDGIQDPGNMGTILRTALAAGIDGVLISPESCDIMNPKVVRASLGAVFFCPIAYSDIDYLQSSSHTIIASVLADSKPIFKLTNIPQKKIIVIGSEAKGISPEIVKIAHEKIHIPMTNQIESLNAAISAAVILYYIKGLEYNE